MTTEETFAAFAFKLGAMASRLGRDRHGNPYRVGSSSSDQWHNGWEAALRRSDLDDR